MLWFPHAKINIGLSILNKRNDGFHSIESMICPIPMYDILEIVESLPRDSNKNKKDNLVFSGQPIHCPKDDNLVWKALILLRNKYNFPTVDIHLHKQIPSGAGLGGGSSDAAYTLMGINQLFRLGLNYKQLHAFAVELGSDCAFFLKYQSQFAWGRGELLRDYSLSIDSCKLALIVPDFKVSTQQAYARISPDKPDKKLINAIERPMKFWKEEIVNHFESIVFKDFPALLNLKEELYNEGAIYSSLSGSGSSVYAMFSQQKELQLRIQ